MHPELPHIHIYFPAILLSVVLAFFFGGLWYGPLFGRTWGTIMGMDMTKKPCAKDMIKPMVIQVIGCFLTAMVLANILEVWRPTTWDAGADGASWMYGVNGAFWVWLGFYVPLQLNKVGWEMRPWKLFFINAGHDLINLLIIGQVLANWR